MAVDGIIIFSTELRMSESIENHTFENFQKKHLPKNTSRSEFLSAVPTRKAVKTRQSRGKKPLLDLSVLTVFILTNGLNEFARGVFLVLVITSLSHPKEG